MRGAKASFVDAYAASQGRALLRFDYSGHGESAFDTPGGRFEDGAIGDWLEQSLSLFEVSTRGPQILIGTSMGAWIALLLARRLNEIRLRDRLRALLLLAPAVDFTEELLWKTLPAAARRLIAEKGVYARPSPYGATPTPITRRLVEEGRAHLLLGGPVRAHAPTHIVQGVLDKDVPWRHALALADRLVDDPVTISLVSDGDHRLSRPQDLARLVTTLDALGEARGTRRTLSATAARRPPLSRSCLTLCYSAMMLANKSFGISNERRRFDRYPTVVRQRSNGFGAAFDGFWARPAARHRRRGEHRAVDRWL
jgi:pimeloyl-ACP methyl ester carboxylesterase